MDLKEIVDILHSVKFKDHMKEIFIGRVKRGNYSDGFKHKLIRARSIDVCPNDINIELLRDELKRNGVEFKPYTDVYSANLQALWAFFCGGIFVIQYDDIVNYDQGSEKSSLVSVNRNGVHNMTKKIRDILKKIYENFLQMTRKKTKISNSKKSKNSQIAEIAENSQIVKNSQIDKRSRMTFAPKSLNSKNQIGSGREIIKNRGETFVPSWYPLAQTLFTVKNDRELYGSSIPSNNPTALIETLKFYMFNLGIKQLVSIQSCEIWDKQHNKFMNSDEQTLIYDNNPNNWNNYRCTKEYDKDRPINAEEMTWELLNKTSGKYDNDINYYAIPIQDMTAGNIVEWINFSKIKKNIPTLVHCFAGFGRTGAFLLFDSLNTNDFYNRCQLPWLGYDNMDDMTDQLLVDFMFNISSVTYEGNKEHEINRRINIANPQATAIEVFVCNDVFSKNLLLKRLNRIILTTILSRNKINLPSIYLFNITEDMEFTQSLFVLTDLNRILLLFHLFNANVF